MPEEWTPIGVESLEAEAERAVRSSGNELVIAGPGAGKTELLAQRACFLLQTGLCSRPVRILAISFKRDAARNLQERVLERCGPELARRFDSMTFDAFAKGLLDRFRLALPEVWRPTGNYKLDFSIGERDAKKWLEQIPSDEGGLTVAELATMNSERMYREEFIGTALPETPATPTTLRTRAAASLWRYLLHHGDESSLNFQMIGRLAELLLRVNPKILRALRATYGFVFLDEFQDTTGIQFGLAQTAFVGSSAVLTAVGDNKQRIMGWAGALDEIFPEFQAAFGVAAPIRLANNYRSAPEIVRVLGILTAALDEHAAVPLAVVDDAEGAGECRVLLFEDHDAESEWLADAVESWLAEGLAPRDICILTRMRPGDYTETIRAALHNRDIEARVESELQDILSEPVTTLVLDVLKLAAKRQSPESRLAVLDLLTDFEGGDSDAVGQKVESQLAALVKQTRAQIARGDTAPEDVPVVLEGIIEFFGRNRLGVAFPQYSQGQLLDETIAGLAKSLAAYLSDREWDSALDALVGLGSVPIMTMHKSKGLEYHTVVFVGLEDSALWSFANSQAEETRGFFVAFSRAKQRVIFTFCHERPKYAGKAAVPQQRNQIGSLYGLLEAAGITPEES
ncbi:MAG: ATP-dependent helicase [Phycisphaerales bacterium]|nr:ATP-dependent helicase [Phycisphaerales bacterium]